MYCAICNKEEELGIELLGIKVCEACIGDISTTPVFTEKYDYYKEIIKVVLKNYMYERAKLNPVS